MAALSAEPPPCLSVARTYLVLPPHGSDVLGDACARRAEPLRVKRRQDEPRAAAALGRRTRLAFAPAHALQHLEAKLLARHALEQAPRRALRRAALGGRHGAAAARRRSLSTAAACPRSGGCSSQQHARGVFARRYDAQSADRVMRPGPRPPRLPDRKRNWASPNSGPAPELRRGLCAGG